MHEVLVNGSGAQSLPRKSVVRLIDGPDMTSDVYHKRKTPPQPKKPGCQQKGKNQFQWKEEPGPVIEPGSSGTPYRLYYMGWVSVGREESMSMKGSDRTRYQAQDLWLLRQTPYRLHYTALISAAQTAEGKNQSKWREVPRPGIGSGTSGSWVRHYTSSTIWPGYQRKGEKSV